MDRVFRNGGGRGSGKGTQPPQITAQQPCLPQHACPVGEAPRGRCPGPARGRCPSFPGPPSRGIPRPPSPAAAARPRLCLRRRAPALARPTFPGVQAVIRSPISWWILLKRQRSRSRTKAIVLFPPLDSASLLECPFIYNFHCVWFWGVGGPCAFQGSQDTEQGKVGGV